MLKNTCCTQKKTKKLNNFFRFSEVFFGFFLDSSLWIVPPSTTAVGGDEAAAAGVLGEPTARGFGLRLREEGRGGCGAAGSAAAGQGRCGFSHVFSDVWYVWVSINQSWLEVPGSQLVEIYF